MKKIIVYILMIFIFSNFQKNDFEKVLLKNYWYFYDGEKLPDPYFVVELTMFKENGECLHLNRFTKEQIGKKNNWKYNRVSKTLTFFQKNYKVLKISGDTLIIQRIGKNHKSIFLKFELIKVNN